MRVRMPRLPLPSQIGITTKIVLCLALLLALSYGITLMRFHQEMQSFSRQQVEVLGRALSQQVALNNAPLILSKDNLSLNITLQQLVRDPLIQGAEFIDSHGKTLAQAGQLSDQLYEAEIRLKDERLGRTRIYMSSKPMELKLADHFFNTSLFAVLGGILTLLGSAVLCRHLRLPLQQLIHHSSQLIKGEPPSPLDESRRDELGELNRLLNHLHADRLRKPESESAAARPSADPLPEFDLYTPIEPTPKPDSDNNPIDPEDNAAPSNLIEAEMAAEADGTGSRIQPSFKAGVVDGIELSEVLADDEAPQPRLYLFYVDHSHIGSDALDSKEREVLLQTYHCHLSRVCHLYRGELSTDERGNWRVLFHPTDHTQGHGINALCAAQLFSGLYRGMNQQRIRSLSPVLNIRMVLVTGEIDEAPLLGDQAIVLSNATHSNELITHEQLYAVTLLSEKLLFEAGYRSTKEGTYLISALEPAYQALINQQVEHFLKSG